MFLNVPAPLIIAKYVLLILTDRVDNCNSYLVIHFSYARDVDDNNNDNNKNNHSNKYNNILHYLPIEFLTGVYLAESNR